MISEGHFFQLVHMACHCVWVTVVNFVVNSHLLLLFNRIPYGCHLLPSHLCEDLEVAKTCQCRSACLSSFIQITVTMNLHHVAHTVVLVDNMGGTEAPIICYFCSLDCYSQFLDRYLQSNGWLLSGTKALPEVLSSDRGAWSCFLLVTHTCCPRAFTAESKCQSCSEGALSAWSGGLTLPPPLESLFGWNKKRCLAWMNLP